MQRRIVSTPLAIACSILAMISLSAAQEEKVVPVHEEPRHRLVFDSPLTKVLNIQISPGDMTLFHTHSDPILYVTMSTSQTRNQTLGGDWSGSEPAPLRLPQNLLKPATDLAQTSPRGRMMSSTGYAKQPVTHRVFNGGKTLFWLIGTTNATAGDESTAPSADFAAKPEIENRWFRGYRWTLGTEPTAHRHANPVTIVNVGGEAMAEADKPTALDKYGAFVFYEANVPHTLRATKAGAELIEVEVRRPR